MFNWFKRFQQPDPTPETPESPEVQTPEVAPETTPAVEATPNTPAADDYLAWAKAAYQNIKQKEEVEEVKEVKEVEGEIQELATPEPESIEPEVSEVISQDPIPESVTPDLVEAVEAVQAESIEAIQVEAIDPAPIDLDRVEPEIIEPEAIEVNQEANQELILEAIEPEPITPETIEPEPIEVDQVEPAAIASVPNETPEPLELSPESSPVISESITPEPETPEISLPLWARETEAERLARLESLVVEEPIPQEVEQPQPTPRVPDVVFDEGFLWSAQVLASQGRRPEDVTVEEISWLKRLRQGLEKTRLSLINQLKFIVGQGPLDKDAVEAIEALLLQADVGVEATDYIITTLQGKLREEVLPPDQAIAYLKKILRDLLDQPYQNNYTAAFVPDKDTLNIWMMTGVNGAGKTTTIGKLAHLAQKSGYSCLIGAADTFRAAAVEQVKIWGQRSGTEVIANPGQNT
ncbi:MAG: signal recognition particle-docking protein FtsY, partial [Coleofasciculaceae cyanobacterium SM2_1_6]|nr:signal recognition particle-docking protein FtsY [Coleofasciculaceae cyanobacterium SM2_1_6]